MGDTADISGDLNGAQPAPREDEAPAAEPELSFDLRYLFLRDYCVRAKAIAAGLLPADAHAAEAEEAARTDDGNGNGEETSTQVAPGDCRRCAEACPAGAITIGGPTVVNIDNTVCTGCGLCQGVCDAFSATAAGGPADTHAQAVSAAAVNESVIITCDRALPDGFDPAPNVIAVRCMAALPAELWALMLAERLPIEVACDFGACMDCPRGAGGVVDAFMDTMEAGQAAADTELLFTDRIPAKTGLVNALIGADGADSATDRREGIARIVAGIEDIASGDYRRRESAAEQTQRTAHERLAAFSRLALSNTPTMNPFAPRGLVKQTMWPRRQLLLAAMTADESVAERVNVTVAQTNCELCTDSLGCLCACPTGARYPDPATGTLCFENRYCIGCGLCVARCENGAVSLKTLTAACLLEEPREDIR